MTPMDSQGQLIIGEQRTPAKQAGEQQLLGPHHAVDGLVWGIPNGAHRERLRHPLRLALVALRVPLDVWRYLRSIQGSTSRTWS